MSIRDRLLDGPPKHDAPSRAKRDHPTGWDVTQRGGTATVQSPPLSQNADEAMLLSGAGLDPDSWRIVDGTIETRRWQQQPGDEWLYYYRFKAATADQFSDEGWDEAIAKLAKHKPRRPKKRPVKHARIFCIADLQAGKGEGGGSGALAQRVTQFIDEATAIVKREKPDAVYILGMGDLNESCTGSYPSQEFTTDMDNRQQARFVRRTLLAIITAVAPHTPRVICGTTPSNHGEYRKNGKAYTGTGDSKDMELLESVQEAIELAPAYKHVSFVIPDDEIATTFDICGTIVGITHGHKFGKGSTPQQKAVEWWKAQSLAGHPVGDASCLINAHFHAYQAMNTHGRMWFQCPSADGGSRWFRDKTGEWSQPGFLTLSIDENGIRDHSVLWSDHKGGGPE